MTILNYQLVQEASLYTTSCPVVNVIFGAVNSHMPASLQDHIESSFQLLTSGAPFTTTSLLHDPRKVSAGTPDSWRSAEIRQSLTDRNVSVPSLNMLGRLMVQEMAHGEKRERTPGNGPPRATSNAKLYRNGSPRLIKPIERQNLTFPVKHFGDQSRDRSDQVATRSFPSPLGKAHWSRPMPSAPLLAWSPSMTLRLGGGKTPCHQPVNQPASHRTSAGPSAVPEPRCVSHRGIWRTSCPS